ncbi:DegT/DnrJ/EryC1/StrS family aminotransferase [bacterium]|nr:DegT/DnrJ/EryC1/StrS family aminotransferase [bacterium]
MEIPSTKPFFREEDIQIISDEVCTILRSGQLILGPYTQEFERNFREYCGVKHAVAVSSCTAALEIAFRYFDVRGKEVIIPTNTFIASSNAVLYAGGTPVLADIKANTLCLDPKDVLKRITPKTCGVMVVHIAGLVCPEIDKLREICQEKGFFLLEDAAHAHGATINGKKAGSLGNVGCFSFYPTKVMTSCVGGMITTDDDCLAEYAISLRHHGVGKDLNDIVNLGNNWLMSEIHALLGIYQLRALEANLQRRNEIAQRYADSLSEVEGVNLLRVPPHIRHSYYKYPIRLSETVDKAKLVAVMKDRYSISLGSAYDPPCHLQPAYQRLFGFHNGMFPVAERILKRVVSLPMFVQMTDEEVDYVVQSLKEVIAYCQERDRE